MRSLFLILIGLLVGCEKTPLAATPSPTTLPTGTASIEGRVTFSGPVPPARSILVNDANCSCQQVLEQKIKVTDTGLADAIVYLELAARADGSARPAALLDQVHCQYTPHVVAVQVNQTLMVRSSDPTTHNVHFEPVLNQPRDLSMSVPGEQVPLRFAEPEFIRFRCDVHPWMEAWVGVFAHPYFAVTDSQGRFRIEHLPDGAYSIAAWHELLGQRHSAVTLSAGSAARADISFDPAR